MDITKSIVFFGNERLATSVETTAPTLQALIDAGYSVKAVVANYEHSTSRKPRPLEIIEVAKKHQVPVFLPDRPADIIDELRSLDASIGVLVAYGRIVPQSIIDLFPHGIINIHPSLLPKHRGPTPIESVILDGETETGVSIMALSAAMDAGPVYSQTHFEVDPSINKQSLADQLLTQGSQQIVETVSEILAGTANPRPQDETAATFDQLITKSHGQLDFTKPAIQLEREVRAYLGWPGSFTTLGDKQIIVTKAHVLETTDQHSIGEVFTCDNLLCFQTSDGVFAVESLKPAGKKEMPSSAFLLGYKL